MNNLTPQQMLYKMVEKYSWLGKEYCRLIGNNKPYKANQAVFEEMATKVLGYISKLEKRNKMLEKMICKEKEE